MFSPVDLEEQPFYKCHFCDVIFTSFPSIVKHNNLYCARRNKLPRSATVTSSTSPDDLSTSEKSTGPDVVQDLDVVGMSEESSGSCDGSQTSEDATSVSLEDVAEYFRKRIGTLQSLATAAPLAEVKSRAKRKMAEVDREMEEKSSLVEETQNLKSSRQS